MSAEKCILTSVFAPVFCGEYGKVHSSPGFVISVLD